MSSKSKPTSRSSRNSPDGDPIAVLYNVARPRDGHPLLNYGIRFRGMAFARRGEQGQYDPRYYDTAIATFGRLPRIYHNALLARGTEARRGLPLAKHWDDVRLMAILLELAPPYELSDLAEAFPQLQAGDSSIHSGPIDYGRMPKHAQRCLQEVELLSRLFYDSGMRERIHDEGLDFIYRLERKVIAPTLAMIYAGVGVNEPRLGEIVGKCNRRVFALRDRLHHIAGPRIKLDSAEQVTKFMREKLELPVVQGKYDGTSPLDQRLLRRLAEVDRSGFVELLLKRQRAVSLQRHFISTYRRVRNDTKRVHTNLDSLVASTGRFGCDDPPLLAVPRQLLEVFVADKDHLLVEAEFNSFELRVLAHFTQDRALCRAFGEHGKMVDLRRRTAAIALGIDENSVTKEQRNRIGHAINLALATGQTEVGLAEALDIPTEKVGRFVERVFRTYPRVRKWIEATEREAESKGNARTLYGRRRTLADVDSSEAEHSRSTRQAVSHILQGTGVDILKLAICRIFRALPSGCRMLLPLHSSLLFEVPRTEISRTVALIKEVLEEPPPEFTVPLAVKIRCGETWAECREAPREKIDV